MSLLGLHVDGSHVSSILVLDRLGDDFLTASCHLRRSSHPSRYIHLINYVPLKSL